jgi:hypothetical protein
MSNLLVPDVKEESLKSLRARAILHGWTLQTEVRAILEKAALAAEPRALQGWSEELPSMAPEEDELDSVGLLMQYMADTCPESRTAWRPATENRDLDSVDLLLQYMADTCPAMGR